jgi:predicted negative regulator of RcsB-dependent stress response
MSNDQLDEYEQGERVRKWLRDNGGSLFGGIAIGLAAIAGFQFYQGRQDQQRVEASRQFESFLTAQEAGEGDQAAGLAASLSANFADTPYPALAALRRGAALVNEGKAEDALNVLEAAVPGTKDAALAQVLQLRAARAELMLGRHDAALARLDAVDFDAYRAIRDELRGDALAGQGKRDEARKAYADALVATDIASPTRVLLELKLADAGGSTTSPEA